MLSQALEKGTIFKVTMQIPPALLSPTLMVCSYLCLQVHMCMCIWLCIVSLYMYSYMSCCVA